MSRTPTTSIPSGFAAELASFATNLVAPTPTEHVIPCSSAIRSRSIRAMPVGVPRRRRAPATSRNASSRLRGSTNGVIERKISMTPRDTSAYMPWVGCSTTACGHSRLARPMGMAAWTPLTLASYVADSTTPRVPPPTMTGRPTSSGRERSSTAA